MSSRMVSRGSKTRFFGFVCMVLVLSAVLYVFHETQVELDGVRDTASSCTHQLESISSQLQVIVEHKLKLENSLENEKHEHLKTKEDLNALIQDEKQLRDKQNVDSMNRYYEIERNHEVLQEEEKKLIEEFEKLKIKYLEKEKKNEQLTQDLNSALSQIQKLKNEKIKSDSGKENDKDQDNILQRSNEFSDIKFIEKSSDNVNVSKLSSVTPAINPQAIDGATAKSSTPMIGSKLSPTNESLHIENDEANPINQPSINMPKAVQIFDSDSGTLNETYPTQESQVKENEPIKYIPAPPEEDNVKKEKNNSEDEKLPKQTNNNLYDYEHFKEEGEVDKEDEDINDFDTREDNQAIRYTR